MLLTRSKHCRAQTSCVCVTQSRKQSWVAWAKNGSKSASENNLLAWDRPAGATAPEAASQAHGQDAGNGTATHAAAADDGARAAAAHSEDAAKGQHRHRRTGSRSAWWPLGRVRTSLGAAMCMYTLSVSPVPTSTLPRPLCQSKACCIAIAVPDVACCSAPRVRPRFSVIAQCGIACLWVAINCSTFARNTHARASMQAPTRGLCSTHRVLPA